MMIRKFTFLALLVPAALSAQWNGVRYDQQSTYVKIRATDANNVFAIGLDPNTSRYHLARTPDGGANWDTLTIDNAASGLYYQAQSMFWLNTNTGFLGGFVNQNTQALLKSTDNGTTWTPVTPNPSSGDGIAAIFFLDANNGYAGAGYEFYRTTDGGATWTTYTTTFYITDIYFKTPAEGLVSGSIGAMAVMMKTTNGGNSWTMVLNAVDPNLFVSQFGRIDALNNDTICTFMNFTDRLYRTYNGGQTWDTIHVDSAATDMITDFDYSDAQTVHVLTGSGRIFASYDDHLSWTREYATEWGFYGPLVYLYSLSFVGDIGYACGSSGLIKKHDPATLGAGEVHVPDGLRLFPNPLTGGQELFLSAGDLTGSCTVEILDARGQLMFRENTMAEPGRRITLPGLQLAAGMYFVNVRSEEKTIAQKLVVQ